MATNNERLDALMAALYDANNTPQKETNLVNAVLDSVPDYEAQEKFTVNTADLNANQKAYFVLDRFRAHAKALKHQARRRAAQKAARAARDAVLAAETDDV